MKQSEMRAPGRRAAWPPASFGRNVEQPEEAEDFTIRGGEAIHVVVHASVVPDAKSLEELRAAVREATRAGVLDGYAAALQDMDAGGEQPGGGDGDAPPGEPSAG